MLKKVKFILVHNHFQPIKDPMSILAYCIQKGANCYYNHVEILIEEDGFLYVIGAVYPRVRKIGFSQWYNKLERDFKIVDFETDKSAEEMISFANSQVGKKYDLASLFFFIPFLLVFKKWIGRKSNKAAKRPYCYELAAQVAGWTDCYDITPNEVLERIKQAA